MRKHVADIKSQIISTEIELAQTARLIKSQKAAQALTPPADFKAITDANQMIGSFREAYDDAMKTVLALEIAPGPDEADESRQTALLAVSAAQELGNKASQKLLLLPGVQATPRSKQ